MKKLLVVLAFTQFCVLQIFAQESSVKILLNDEERFRFDSIRLEFINSGHHVMIGDSAGMDNYGNSQTIENTFIGHRAGSYNLSGQYNTFMGARSGESHINGINNVYLGAWAGRWDSTGNSNTYIGADAGEDNKNGHANTYIGYAAGAHDSAGILNVFIGTTSGLHNKSGIENTYVGTSAGASNTTGSNNTCIGRRAGLNNTNGSGNVFLGFYAGSNEQGSDKLYISNSDTPEPLIYGEFDNKMLRFNANRMEMRNSLENTILGDSSGTMLYGNQNVMVGTQAGKMTTGGNRNTFIGYQAGWSDTTGWGNVFVGMQTGLQNTTGNRNTFIGTTAGYSNSTGLRNTFVGLTAGGYNTTGSYNTYLGRIAGYLNETGDSNVFIGNAAGQYEMGSNKLYISNSETTEPLIYGDFEQNKLKFHADSVQTSGVVHAAGEVRTDEYFNANGEPGITDTINTITAYNFTESKLKYRTTVYNGGIATFMSLESLWVDEVGEYLVPCGEIGLVGEFNNWTDDVLMTRNAYNPDLWTLSITLTAEDDLSDPPVGIIEVKFREDASWEVSWGWDDFPSGIGTNQYGHNIPVTLSAEDDETLYFINFNCRTGAYSFTDLTGYCEDSVTDSRDGKKYATVLKGNQCWMAQDLNVGTRIDGSSDQTNNQTIEKYCYDNQESNCTQWGGLYQRPELMQYITTPGTRGICMAGWHVPTDEEFKTLEGNVDSQFGLDAPEWNKTGWRGYDAGLNLRAATGWSGNGNGTDAFGFHAVPGGYLVDYNLFNDGGACLNYQTSSSDIYGAPVIRHINGDFNQVTRNTNPADDGCSLRCLKD